MGDSLSRGSPASAWENSAVAVEIQQSRKVIRFIPDQCPFDFGSAMQPMVNCLRPGNRLPAYLPKRHRIRRRIEAKNHAGLKVLDRAR